MLGALFSSTTQDVRYGLRLLRRSPAFTVTAVMTLALTLGAVSTVLSLYNGLVLRPLAAPRPDELVVVNPKRMDPRRGVPDWGRVSYLDYTRVRDRVMTVRDLAAHGAGGSPQWVVYRGHAREMGHAYVSANFFSVLELRPAFGRFFHADENTVPNRDHVVVLSHHLWEEWGRPADVVGDGVKIAGRDYTVIGVAPASFGGLDPQRVELYMPALLLGGHMRSPCDMLGDSRCGPAFHMIGRLSPDRSVEEVNAEVATLSPPWWKEQAKPDNPAMVLAAHGPRGAYGVYGRFTFERSLGAAHPLALVAGSCLLLGCANLASVLLARGPSRARELAIRPSLGATPRRLLRQLMTESILLAVVGGVLGVLLSVALTRALHALYLEWSGGRLHSFDLNPDPVVLVWTTAVSVGTSFLFGLAPAIRAIGLGTTMNLSRETTAAATSFPLTRWLIGAQVASALALLVQVTLLWSGSRRFVTEGHFDPQNVALLRVAPGSVQYKPEKTRELHQEALRRLAAFPGVTRVSAMSDGSVISGHAGYRDNLTIARSPGSPSAPSDVRGRRTAVTPGHFAVLGTPILRGRDFDARDARESATVAIVNEALSRRLWPEGHALGSFLLVHDGPADKRTATGPAEIVGVVADVAAPRWGQTAVPHVYLHFQQADVVNARYCVKVQTNPAAALARLAGIVHEIDPDVPINDAMTLTAHLDRGERREVRVTAWVASYGAVVALLLCAVGIYGTLSFAVARRTKEIGVRMAVGASPRDVLRLILRGEMKVVLAGAAAGLGLAWAISRFIHHLLFGEPASDVGLYASAALVIVTVGLTACWLAARRATRLDPVAALKVD